MAGMMYLLGIALAILAGFHLTRNPKHGGPRTEGSDNSVGGAKASFEGSGGIRRDGYRLYMGPVVMHLGPLIGFGVLFLGIIFIMDITYAHYIGSVRAFLTYALGASVLGLLASALVRSMEGELDTESVSERIKESGLFSAGGGAMLPIAIVIVLVITLVSLGPAASAVCIVPIFIVLIITLTATFRARKAAAGGEKKDAGEKSSLFVPGRWTDTARMVIAVFTLLMLILSSFLPYVNPSELTDNPLYSSLTFDHVAGDNPETLDDPQEVRVVSWQLATEYLVRSYGDSAAFLDSSEGGLLEYTDPAYVNGRFVWVNAPYYEAWKWFGGKTVPFFVYVENDPANLTGETPPATHKVKTELETHETRITWAKRLEQLTFDRYAAKFEIAQIRFTIDDEEHPYWIIYLAERDLWYNRLHLDRLLVVNAMDFDDNVEYRITDLDIPEWLEVVYPDEYVYNWVRFWAENRFGLGYKWFNKAHLYEPDDVAARFIVINGLTYWQIPLVQKNSQVLGGYVWVDTRTGDARFFNRENRSLADKDTVQAQIEKYLSSGALGFQRLDIHEGYLYPMRLGSGEVREAYVFPLYAGLTVLKYAVVDAEDYTSEPFIENELGAALDRYRGRSGSGGIDIDWQGVVLETGYVEGEEAVISISNSTVTNLTLVVDLQDLDRGLLTQGEDEMRELKLAVAAWGRGDEVDLRIVLVGSSVLDVDWEGADLVP
jgi:hypothetical protein